jgi:iron complex transport system permease protein
MTTTAPSADARVVDPADRSGDDPGGAGSPTGRPLVPALVFLTGVLVLSALIGIAVGPTSVPLGDTVRYLHAAITGGTIPATELSAYNIVWQVRTPACCWPSSSGPD